jgi:type I site-specific restriction endonuclease
MLELNLPAFECKIKQKESRLYIYDAVRRKYVALTPEEWVRQHFLHHLINDHGVSKNLISLEYSFEYNDLSKRSDIILWTRERKPALVIECKAPNVDLSDKTIFQAGLYNHKLGAPHIGITNGLAHYFFRRADADWQLLDDISFIQNLSK